jgi:hypothetical protein
VGDTLGMNLLTRTILNPSGKLIRVISALSWTEPRIGTELGHLTNYEYEHKVKDERHFLSLFQIL